jgi:hypothetical protein
MKRLVVCGIVILTALGLMVGSSYGNWFNGRDRYDDRYRYGRGPNVGVTVGSPDYVEGPVVETYPAPVVYGSPGYYGGYPYRDRPSVGLSIGGRHGGIGFGF